MRRALGTALAAGIVAGLLGGLPAATAAPSSPSAVTAAAPTTSEAAARPSTRPPLKYKVLVLHPAVVSKADRAGINALRTLGRERGFTLETTSDTSSAVRGRIATSGMNSAQRCTGNGAGTRVRFTREDMPGSTRSGSPMIPRSSSITPSSTALLKATVMAAPP